MSAMHAPGLLLAPPPWRACQLCSYGLDVAAERHCACPAVAGQRRSVPVEDARRNTGPCGPEAQYLDFPGLNA